MFSRHSIAIAAIISLGIALAGTHISAQQKDHPDDAKYRERVQELARLVEPHWSDEHLRSLEAESTPEQSIYLSAVMLTRMEREQGDVSKVEPYLEELAKRSPSQPLKSAVRRLIVEINLERKDFKGAERQLKLIVDENLAQF
ncbi:hypothetical protein IT570_04525 [Candidatus Sumerlaeota bacterium]|nr:hypothetical protein [Candidatus Sumerlaeota bacterium]